MLTGLGPGPSQAPWLLEDQGKIRTIDFIKKQMLSSRPTGEDNCTMPPLKSNPTASALARTAMLFHTSNAFAVCLFFLPQLYRMNFVL